MPLINLPEANRKQFIQGFVPRIGTELVGGDPYTPTETEVYKLATVVDVTIDGVTCEYQKGEKLILEKGITYTFGSDTPVHKM